MSIQRKMYFLVALNIVFLASLFLWISDVHIVQDESAHVESNLQPVKVIITDYRDSSVFSFLNNQNDGWTLNFNQIRCNANEHALGKILYCLNTILNERRTTGFIPLHDLSYSVQSVDSMGHTTRFDIFNNGTKITQKERTFYSSSTDLGEYFFRSGKNFADEILWEKDVKAARFLKIQCANIILTFAKKNNVWHMERPFNRPINNFIVGDLLKFLHDIHCSVVVINQPIVSPDLEITVGSGDFQVKLDFLQKNGKFFVQKNGVVFEIPAEFGNYLENLFEMPLRLRIFDDIRIDSLELQSVTDEKTILLQKLEAIDKWQVSLRDDKSIKFSEIGSDQIINLKKFLSELSLREQLHIKIKGKPVKYHLRLYSSIGVLNFQIFADSQQCMLLHEESGAIFGVPCEFMKILNEVIDICGQDDEGDSTGRSS